MKDTQYLRTALADYMKAHGSTQKFISKILSVSPSLISHFLKGRRDLGQSNQARLKDFLTKNTRI